MNDKYYEDMLAGFALDALDEQEQHATAEHLLECEKCRDECAELAEALHRCFGESVLRRQPSPLVRTQLLARFALEIGPTDQTGLPLRTAAPAEEPLITLHREPPSAATGAPHTPEPMITIEQPPPALQDGAGATVRAEAGHRPYRWAWAGVAVPATLAAVFAVLFMNMKSQYDNEHGHLFASAMAQGHVAMVLTGPAVAHNMAGEVLMPKDGSAGMLIVHGVPARSGGMNYTCWVQRNGRWTDYGTLRPDASGLAMLVLSRNESLHQAQLAITAERMTSPAVPSGPMLLSVHL